MQEAFDKLGFKEQTLLEKRNAVCMTCGRVGSWDERPTFEDLAVMFEGSTASGAERAYKKALDKLTRHLVETGVLGVVELRLTDKNKKIAAAAYEYKAVHRYANDDDEWGEICFDFSAGTSADRKVGRRRYEQNKHVCENYNPQNSGTLHERASEEIDDSI